MTLIGVAYNFQTIKRFPDGKYLVSCKTMRDLTMIVLLKSTVKYTILCKHEKKRWEEKKNYYKILFKHISWGTMNLGTHDDSLDFFISLYFNQIDFNGDK